MVLFPDWSMCGVNGIYAYHYAANPVDKAELLASGDSMERRGPDGRGLWLSDDQHVGLGHRRLAIIDLTEDGLQPMRSADGRYTITFNGEIYNYKELRRELESKGYIFKSQSDTETLLHLYADRGADMVLALRGMFAFAIWDSVKRELFLARDVYGIKPLYYADDGWTFRFASQVKALRAGGRLSNDPDPAGWVGFYLLGSVPEPFTCWRAIRSLPAGCWLKVDRLGPGVPTAYRSVAAALLGGEAAARPVDGAEARAAFLDSVRHHLMADVPVGAFLSAGVDSGALVGLVRDAGAQSLQTITIGFEEFRGRPEDETVIAAEVAAHYGTRHTTRFVSQAEFESDLPKILDAMDQPSIDGVNTWFASKAAHECGLKVVLSGVGGDELLGGYPSFRDIPRLVRLAFGPSRIPFVGRLARHFGGPLLSSRRYSPKAAGVIEYGGSYPGAYLLKRGLFMPWELEKVLDPDIVRSGLRRLQPLNLLKEPLDPKLRSSNARIAALEGSFYLRNQLLRDSDWASMAHSLELRTPLVDSVLLDRVAPMIPALQPQQGKALLADAPSRPLPASIARRAKTGFGTPVARWMGAAARSDASTAVPWARDWSRVIAADVPKVA